MKRTARFHIAGLVVLSSIVVLAAVPVWAQVALRSVKPDSARAGEHEGGRSGARALGHRGGAGDLRVGIFCFCLLFQRQFFQFR